MKHVITTWQNTEYFKEGKLFFRHHQGEYEQVSIETVFSECLMSWVKAQMCYLRKLNNPARERRFTLVKPHEAGPGDLHLASTEAKSLVTEYLVSL